MTRRRTRCSWLIVGLLLAFVAGLAPTRASVVAEDGTSAGGETVTTVLHPGWNMVGWIGDAAPVSDLFDAIPAIESVAAWDADARRYRWARPGGPRPGGLLEFTTGMGLWLRLGGAAPVDWVQRPTEDYVLLELKAGRNLVAWTGEDGELMRTVARQLGPAFEGASRWDAGTRRQESFSRLDPPRYLLRELNRGDAVWVDLASDGRWWQSGTARTTFAYSEGMAPQDQLGLRTDMQLAIAFFAQRYGIEPPEFTVSVIPGKSYAYAAGREIVIPSWFRHEVVATKLAHEYIHVLQYVLAESSGAWRATPTWLVEGTAMYGQVQVARHLAVPVEDSRETWSAVSDTVPPLREFESVWALDAPHVYGLGYLAVEWLMGHAAATAAGERFRPLVDGVDDDLTGDDYIRYWGAAPSGRWEDALEQAFGIAGNDFYGAFESYRVGIRAQLAAGPSYGSDPAAVDGAAMIGDYGRGYSVVLDADGIPVAGAWVVAWTGGSRHSGVGLVGAREITLTDADGAFELEGASTPRSWAVILGDGCRVASEQLAVRRMSEAVFEIRLLVRSPCGAS